MYVDLVVRRGGKCSAERLLANLCLAVDPAVAKIDLTYSTWCEPAGLVAVAAFAEEQRILGRAVQVMAPRDPNQVNYLARMHLGQVLDELGCEHSITPVRESQDVELLELQRFEGEDGAADLAGLVYEKTAADPAVAAALHKSIGEIGGNVSQHSGKTIGYVAAASTYRRRRIEFAVCGRWLGADAQPCETRDRE